MKIRSVGALLTATLMAAGVGQLSGEAATRSATSPAPDAAGPLRWQRHLELHPHGNLSATLRDVLGGDATNAPGAIPDNSSTGKFSPGNASLSSRRDRQINVDSAPAVRQSNPTVTASLRRPRVAVAAGNDAIGSSYQILRTSDGGRTWDAVRQEPQLPTGEQCPGRTPSLAYSRRDDAFYLAASCATADGASVVHLWRSVDDGETWTPPQYAGQAVTNVDESTGEPDTSLFYDWQRVAVDNSPASPHYGRVYLTWTKFHLLDSGESDYCPAQVAWTDQVPLVPRDTVFTTTQIGPDVGTGGEGPYTSAWTRVGVQPDGTVLAMYAEESCNTGFDTHVRVARSTDGGASFGEPVAIDQPGEFADNPDLDDVLPDKTANIGISPSIAVSPTTGQVAVAYQNNVSATASGADIWVSTSRDGATWRGQPVSTDSSGSPAPNDQFLSWITSDERGTFWMVWLDNRRDPGNHLIDAWSSVSRDDARSWVGRRLSSASYDPDNTRATGGSSVGVTSAIAATRVAVYPVWLDARDNAFSQTGIGETDLFTSTALHPRACRSSDLRACSP